MGLFYNDKIICLTEKDIINRNKLSNIFFENPGEVIYIVDENNQLKGTISFGDFIDNHLEGSKLINYTCKRIYDSENVKEEAIQIFQTHKNILNIPVVDKNNTILYEFLNIQDFILEKWDNLYKRNENFADMLKSHNYNKLLIWGGEEIGNSNFQKSFLEYLKQYSNWLEYEVIINGKIKDFISLIRNSKSDVLIDLTNDRYGIKKYYYNIIIHHFDLLNESIVKIQTIDQLFDETELNIFMSNFSKKQAYFFELQDIDTITNLTLEEKMRYHNRISWLDYLRESKHNCYFKYLAKKVLKQFYSKEFIESRYKITQPICKNGILYMGDLNNTYCHIINGLRITTDTPIHYKNIIHMFGPCTVFGTMVDDSNTISSFLQRFIKKQYRDHYRVVNHGIQGVSFYESIRKANNMDITQEEIIIFFIRHKKTLELLKKYPDLKIYELSHLFNSDNDLRDYFFEEPIHCNHLANEKIANYVYSIIQSSLEKKLVKGIQKNKGKRNHQKIYENNKKLKEYVKELSKYKTTYKKIGAIVMNCNPFTKGHRYLIEYASNYVEQLYIFVVEENRSIFSFKDRLYMVKDGCKDLTNVIVLPSGQFIISSVTFPEYFEKDSSMYQKIDTSFDIEVFAQHIAPVLNISIRFVGEEPIDNITRQYNETMKEILPKYNIDVIEIPRLEYKKGKPVSATEVRKLLHANEFEKIKDIVPSTTYNYLIENKCYNFKEK